ncbi:MAG: hypothetical protein RLZZ74_3413 [Cyanobacteriota bacterium]|jgi:hypothetical protein
MKNNQDFVIFVDNLVLFLVALCQVVSISCIIFLFFWIIFSKND